MLKVFCCGKSPAEFRDSIPMGVVTEYP